MNSLSIIILGVCATVGAALAGDRAGLTPTNVPARIELRDQFESLRVLVFPTTNLTLLTIADKDGSAQLAAWVLPLQERFSKGLAIEGIADVSAVPRPLRAMVRRRFQQAQSHSVMLDWTGDTTKQFAISANQANVLLVDCDGSILKRMTGKATGQGIKELCETIEQNLASRKAPTEGR